MMDAENTEFRDRHIGVTDQDITDMLKQLGMDSLSELIEKTIPQNILSHRQWDLPPAHSEQDALKKLFQIMSENQVCKCYIGMGYHPTWIPSVIQRNVLENPGWYTQYTPYQPEIAQGRLEALINFQTMVCDLTAMPLSNASLLDEATATAEAMSLVFHIQNKNYRRNTATSKRKCLISTHCHPSTLAVLKLRMSALGLEACFMDPASIHQTTDFSDYFGLILQYPDTYGDLSDHTDLIQKARQQDCLTIVVTDLLALTLLKPPGEMGASVVVGNTQRLGVPMGFGGPSAAFLASREEYKRQIPGRIVGLSKDKLGRPAYRLALQTREQHIRRERATSNICTAQTLLAVMASLYACWHGPKGLKKIAGRIFKQTKKLQQGLEKLGFLTVNSAFFDTLHIRLTNTDLLMQKAKKQHINLRWVNQQDVCITLNETTTSSDVDELLMLFKDLPLSHRQQNHLSEEQMVREKGIPKALVRKSDFLTHKVFNAYHSETEMLRYIHRLQSRDLSLAHSMIPLGSCTMKLNASTEMLPLSWPSVANIHPFAPAEQTKGYLKMIQQLEKWLAECVGFDATSVQPNAGSQGELTGLLIIKKYHESRGQSRHICLIPESAHGTNPASAVMAGFKVVAIKCSKDGNIDLKDLQEKIQIHQKDIAAIMITYPSTHGVFETSIQQICHKVHEVGGQVYLDGANMNAQIGLCFPGEYGPDICHLNLHKTFAIPHGGGGPGVGPVVMKKHLQPFLPRVDLNNKQHEGIEMVSQAPYGSGSICNISWLYILMLGGSGLKKVSEVAILNANYMAQRLEKYFPILYKGEDGCVAHECILDLRQWQKRAGIHVEDVAKRLMDYGFHAPTMSWPVAGTLMVEPTESESKSEMDRFCDAMISIHGELLKVESGDFDKNDNPLKQAPHTLLEVSGDQWLHSYSRELAAFPLSYLKEHKFWPSVGRIDGSYGDKNLFCVCFSSK